VVVEARATFGNPEILMAVPGIWWHLANHYGFSRQLSAGLAKTS
jgi:hypothetical protein